MADPLTRTVALALALAMLTAACSQDEGTRNPQTPLPAAQPTAVPGLSERSNFRMPQAEGSVTAGLDPAGLPQAVFAGDRSEAMLRVQILLDRARFSPGVIDGRPGENVRKAVEAYQRANSLTADGDLSPALLTHLSGADARPLLRRYEIVQADLAGPFNRSIPERMEAQAKLDHMGYTSPAEKLAEKFHMDVDLLRAMNPGADFGSAGTVIAVVERGSDELSTPVARVEVDKAMMAVRAYAADGRLLAFYPATIGSQSLPSPSGELEVTRIAIDPTYHYDPDKLSFGESKRALVLPPGPNNPVGSVWIALSRDGYGIHGTPDPALIGKTASHGCVRLTNWDAEELGGALEKGVPVHFVGGETT